MMAITTSSSTDGTLVHFVALGEIPMMAITTSSSTSVNPRFTNFDFMIKNYA
jgi:hypothetical protein